MRNILKIHKISILFLICVILMVTNMSYCRAEEAEQGETTQSIVYQNEETGYTLIIEDGADLLTPEEEEELAATMEGITRYGNVAFKSAVDVNVSTSSYAQSFFRENFGKKSGTVFLIDMSNRNLWIFSDGSIYETITKSYANIITDNVYRYASGGDYFGCANEAFSEMDTLLQGRRIAQPMKYISNALLAAILALLFNFAFMCYVTRAKQPDQQELLKKAKKSFICTNSQALLRNTTKTYSPQSSGDSSSGGSSGSSGGSSGGGGGHSF